ncbi:MAG: SDR family NAD(P)-dependent oxidoreductase [Pseudobdellovibrio sp.]
MSDHDRHLKFILCGASRGLGWQTYLKLAKRYPEAQFLLVSRKIETQLENLLPQTEIFKHDFSKTELSLEFKSKIETFNPTHFLYIAGGGPHGLFESKKWSDHQWAMNVCYSTPAQIIHYLLQNKNVFNQLLRIVLVGSAIAEDKPDPLASSYAAAKHALRGLISSIQQESPNYSELIKLFSPGYIQTDLLPAHSWPRQHGLAQSAENVADDLIGFID